MSDIGPKRQMQECVEKAKRGRPEKKPGYDKAEVIDDLLQKAVELFEEPFDDRQERSEDAPSLSYVAESLGISKPKARKLLITAGYYSTALSRQIQKLQNEGLSISEIVERTGLGQTSVHCYLPYSKGAYNLENPTLYAEQGRLYRKRKCVCEELADHLDCAEAEQYLWEAIEAFAGYPFFTAKGLPLKYTVKGGELFFNRKEKSITRATVMEAFHKARELQKTYGFVSGPKKLGTFGASYLYAVFLRIGVCCKKACEG